VSAWRVLIGFIRNGERERERNGGRMRERDGVIRMVSYE